MKRIIVFVIVLFTSGVYSPYVVQATEIEHQKKVLEECVKDSLISDIVVTTSILTLTRSSSLENTSIFETQKEFQKQLLGVYDKKRTQIYQMYANFIGLSQKVSVYYKNFDTYATNSSLLKKIILEIKKKLLAQSQLIQSIVSETIMRKTINEFREQLNTYSHTEFESETSKLSSEKRVLKDAENDLKWFIAQEKLGSTAKFIGIGALVATVILATVSVVSTLLTGGGAAPIAVAIFAGLASAVGSSAGLAGGVILETEARKKVDSIKEKIKNSQILIDTLTKNQVICELLSKQTKEVSLTLLDTNDKLGNMAYSVNFLSDHIFSNPENVSITKKELGELNTYLNNLSSEIEDGQNKMMELSFD